MYGMSDFLNLIVLVGICSSTMVSLIEFSRNVFIIQCVKCPVTPYYSMEHRLVPH